MEKQPEGTKLCEGVTIPPRFSEEAFRSAINYRPRNGDIFIVTYPKCGSTWMQRIVLSILRHGKLSDDPLDFFLGCPYLEMTGAEAAEDLIRPGAIKTHLPYNLVPKSKEAKYIYVFRNPKDCFISFYYHMKDVPINENKTFDDFFEHFVTGDTPFGDYFDHITDWYDHRNDPNVYIVTFEDLKNDIRGEILKIAKFIGEEYEKDLLNDPKALDDVIRHSSLQHMQKDINETMRKFLKGEITPSSFGGRKIPRGLSKFMETAKKSPLSSKSSLKFVRKGIVGDWKNHLNPDQVKRLEKRVLEKTANSEVMNLWK